MKKLSRESWLAIALVALLSLVTVAAAVQQARAQVRAEERRLSNLSAAPEGARALWLWLEQAGYAVSDEVGYSFRIPAGMDMVLLLEPQQPLGSDEWTLLDGWVERGGIVVLAGTGWSAGLALRHYGFELVYREGEVAALTAQTPLLSSPPLLVPVQARARACLETARSDYVTHLAVGACPVLVSLAQGQGQVWLTTAWYPFSNAGLKEAGNPALVLNVVRAAGPAGGARPGAAGLGAIWFDEWHHGRRAQREEIVGPEEWLRRTPAGQAVLYAAAVVLLALLLHGRRLGRPVPLPRDTVRRSPLEYVSAIANLGRRAGHRDAALRRYHHTLKRELGRRYRLSPALPDDAYVDRLEAYDPALDAAALRRLLARLSDGRAGEGDMVQLAAEAAEWLERAER